MSAQLISAPSRAGSALPVAFPLHGVAAALVANRAGGVQVVPVIVVDFYREHANV